MFSPCRSALGNEATLSKIQSPSEFCSALTMVAEYLKVSSVVSPPLAATREGA